MNINTRSVVAFLSLFGVSSLAGCDNNEDMGCYSWAKVQIRAASPDTLTGEYQLRFSYDNVEYEGICSTSGKVSCPVQLADGRPWKEESKGFSSIYIHPEATGLSLEFEAGQDFSDWFDKIDLVVLSQEKEIFKGTVNFVHSHDGSTDPEVCSDYTTAEDTVEIDLSTP